MTDEKSVIRPVDKAEFLPAVIRLKKDRWRLAQICAVRIENGYEMSYSFCKEYQLVTLRLVTETKEPVPSITQIYPCAFLQENEAAELFGVPIEEVDPDYHHKLYRIDAETPFKEKG